MYNVYIVDLDHVVFSRWFATSAAAGEYYAHQLHAATGNAAPGTVIVCADDNGVITAKHEF